MSEPTHNAGEIKLNPCKCGGNVGLLNDQAQTRFRVVCPCGNGVEGIWFKSAFEARVAWNASNPPYTHNAGEKCPACKGGGYVPMPQSPVGAVSPSPAADVKERDIVKLACLMFECETLPLTFDRLDIYHALIWHKSEMARLEADLTTKLAALQVENERLKNSVMDQNSILTSLRRQFPTLRAENQGLVKEVESLNGQVERLSKTWQCALNLRNKLLLIHDDPLYQSVWTSAANHGIDYSHGPSYEKELKKLTESFGASNPTPEGE